MELLEGLFEGVYIVDRHRRIIFWNKGSEQITGYSSKEVLNQHCFQNILRHVDLTGKELCKGGCPLHQTLQTGEMLESNVFLHHKEGHRVPITVRTNPIYDDQGNIIAAIEVFSDINYRKNVHHENQRLQEMIVKDELTQVYNRRYLEFKMKNMIIEYQEFQQAFGLLFIDIDDFKLVNDKYGHNVGDEVLKLVSRTISNNVRSKDIVGRWGGEEFVVLAQVNNNDLLKMIAEKLRILVEKSSITTQKGTVIRKTISIGCTLYEEKDTLHDFIDRADKAMYQSKKSGKNKITIL
jgi:diguanylate cyclase (GGDEF)-like protein/PAS domain S-box-containing protein